MPLDARFVIAPAPQQIFIDKDTAEPLIGGKVFFWRDIARTEPKTVYQLTGSPPNYTFAPLPNPITLNAAGAFADALGNDVIVYYFPFLGIPDDNSSTVDLYFIEVYSAGMIFQFSRQAYPNFIGSGSSNDVNIVNFVPNGQFLLHNNLPKTDNFTAGQVRADSTVIAPGGWTFDRSPGATSADFVFFPRFGSDLPDVDPTGNPRYAVNIVNQGPAGGGTVKDLRLRYDDVNKFGSDVQRFTFGFTGLSASGGVSVTLVLIKNFGTGGSATTETPITTFMLGATYSKFSAFFIFGNNTAKIIGPLDDDYVQLALRFPVASLFDATLTDFYLAEGEAPLVAFPDTTNGQFLYRSLAGGFPVPDHNGNDLYLPVRLTPGGLEFDHTNVGKVYATTSKTAGTGEFLCDGTQYNTNNYSGEGIPLSRLGNVLFDSTLNTPLFGTGANFFTASLGVVAANNQVRISNNSFGPVVNTADGAIPTTFTFATIHTGANYYAKAYYTLQSPNNNSVFVILNETGDVTAPAAATSGFTFNIIRPFGPGPKTTTVTNRLNTVFQILTIAPVATPVAKYFTFVTLNGGVPQPWYLWMTVDGTGTDPAPPAHTGIKVDLLSTYTPAEVARILAEVISGQQITTVTTVAPASITAGSFFNIDSTTAAYYIWYEKDGVGPDPMPAGRIAIKVAIVSADTDATVASKTQIAINKRYYAVPDLRGAFIRGWDNGAGIDKETVHRFAKNSIFAGDVIGTMQLDEILQHYNSTGEVQVVEGTVPALGPGDFNLSTDYAGGLESRPFNIALNYIIKI